MFPLKLGFRDLAALMAGYSLDMSRSGSRAAGAGGGNCKNIRFRSHNRALGLWLSKIQSRTRSGGLRHLRTEISCTSRPHRPLKAVLLAFIQARLNGRSLRRPSKGGPWLPANCGIRKGGRVSWLWLCIKFDEHATASIHQCTAVASSSFFVLHVHPPPAAM
jgi:hypothetical protein